jgi:uncharacterized BrkB/YihY/UPF0761 family membrane protein
MCTRLPGTTGDIPVLGSEQQDLGNRDRHRAFIDVVQHELEAYRKRFNLPAPARRRSRPMWSLLKSAVDGFLRHKSARLGAALAYYSVFSLGPLLLIVTAIAGFFFGADAVRGSLISQFRSLLGETGSQAVEAMLKGAESATGGGLAAIFGIGLLIVAALGVVVQLRDALNTIFETKEPDDAGPAWYVRVYALSFAGILALGFCWPFLSWSARALPRSRHGSAAPPR